MFEHVDALGAPRLVEYWEQDPCRAEPPTRVRSTSRDGASGGCADEAGAIAGDDLGVKIEAKFDGRRVPDRDPVGEGLDRASRPGCAARSTRSPTAPSRCCGRTSRAASKFFVAKVDPKKVQVRRRPRRAVAAALPLRQRGVRAADPARPRELGGHAGPDRQHPRAEQALRGRELQERHHPDEPRRQGRGARRSSARSTPRCSIARSRRTRARSSPSTRGRRCRDLRSVPGADAQPDDFMTLGADVVGGPIAARQLRADAPARALRQGDIKDDLVFKRGRADRRRPRACGADGKLEDGAQPSRAEQLPGALRDPPPVDRADRVQEPAARRLGRPAGRQRSRPIAASKLAFAPRGKVQLAEVVTKAIPEIGVRPWSPPKFRPPMGGKK